MTRLLVRSITVYMQEKRQYKTWTLDSGLDHGLDSGINNGLDSYTEILIARGQWSHAF